MSLQRKKGQCSLCVADGNSEEKWLARNKPPTCTYHYQKEQQEKALERKKAKPVSTKYQKKKPRKATGEREVFLDIWNERPHVCEHLCRADT